MLLLATCHLPTARSLVVVLLVAATAVAGLSGSTGTAALAAEAHSERTLAARPASRSMWVWDTGSPRSVIATAERNHVTRLLTWVSPGFTTSPHQLATAKRFKRLADRAGIHLDALGGDPSWAQKPSVAGRWAVEVKRSGLFERLHLDVEPHGLPDWADQRTALGRGLLAALDHARTARMPLDADIPYWFHAVTVDGAKLDVSVIKRVNSITIMSYQRTADLIWKVAATEVAHAAKYKKRAWVGINFGRPDPDGLAATLYGLSSAKTAAIVADVQRNVAATAGAAGIALHDEASLRTLGSSFR
jgi:hypothetical protein